MLPPVVSETGDGEAISRRLQNEMNPLNFPTQEAILRKLQNSTKGENAVNPDVAASLITAATGSHGVKCTLPRDISSYSMRNTPRAPQFTLPGQVWSISTKTRGPGGCSDGAASCTVIECSEDVTAFIGFTPTTSKFVWLQFESGSLSSGELACSDAAASSVSDVSNRQRNYLDFLLGDTSADMTAKSSQSGAGGQGASSDMGSSTIGRMYTVRSVMGNSIELYEDYSGPPVTEGNPLVQVRTDLSRCGKAVAMMPPSTMGETNDDLARLPRYIHAVDFPERGTAAGRLAAIAIHPTLPYVACGLGDGSVKILSAGLS